MLPKIFLIGLNVFLTKVVLSQAIYNASPTVYPPNTVSTVQNYPVLATASAAPTVTVTATSLPSNVHTATIASTVPTAPISAVASPMAGPMATIAASPIPVASTMPVTASAMPVSISPMTVSPMPVPPSSCAAEAKAYFVSGPIPDPKVTVLGDIPSVVEVAPKIYPDSSPLVDPGYIEVKATVCKEPALNAPASNRMLPEKDNSPIAPIKRLSMACASDEPFLAAHKITPNHPFCPGISKMDLIPPSKAQEKKLNPIEFDGLLDGFISCL